MSSATSQQAQKQPADVKKEAPKQAAAPAQTAVNAGSTSGPPTTTTKVPTVINTVTMKDKRKVDFPGKRRMQKESFIDDATGALNVRLDFVNGETLVFTLPKGLINQFALHGAEQKLGDETAGETDVDDMVLAVEKLIERLNAGEWTQKRESDGMAGTSVLIKALVEKYSKTVEQVKSFLKDKTPAQKAALRNSEELKPIVQRLEAEKASKGEKVDTSALLAGLGSI